MEPQPQHDGCWNCGDEAEPILSSHTVYNVVDKNGAPKMPESIATCSKPACMAVDKIDYAERRKRQ
jgi:hypothetical protein